MMPIDRVLSQLSKVKQTGANKWKGCCPAHDDNDPSLAISECDDGKVLLHCWAGCTINQIVESMGMELGDLFPGEKIARRGPSKEAIMRERLIRCIAVNALKRGERLNPEDQARYQLALQRLRSADHA